MALHGFPDFIGYSGLHVVMRSDTGPIGVSRKHLSSSDAVVSLICLGIGGPWLLRTEIPALPRGHVVIRHPVLTALFLVTIYARPYGIFFQDFQTRYKMHCLRDMQTATHPEEWVIQFRLTAYVGWSGKRHPSRGTLNLDVANPIMGRGILSNAMDRRLPSLITVVRHWTPHVGRSGRPNWYAYSRVSWPGTCQK
ncbi:hypothetical protein BO94DRAFT_195942 [Aspergillus sclerotioniger CBS 115572]|uniref:Uncharacterized protein n=1 Tax=Aspergillus sclerotioniger CBS 115572 TaxID=1450535 RepID=A0A317VSH4_9EURO|nr:hypothetical protein BO94DRAFT_195942 [Aspergillus sclerotioniger CBS 115572]PWY77273.1 hypothetical protein BO94DRAFT_195942 [Aspergillus sclerotioniger CBS 115572]